MKQLSIAAFQNTVSRPDPWSYEKVFRSRGYRFIAGIDEAGRGTLCGPVVAAAVILSPDTDLPGVDDSKKLTARTRDVLFDLIKAKARATGVGIATHAEIDTLNILEATRLAMGRAVSALELTPDMLLTDAVALPAVGIPYQAIIHGDALSITISAASIIAKVSRDRIMQSLHQQYPQYAFNRNKGYATQDHRQALAKFGPCPIHRTTFRGVKEFYERRENL